jgi:hypothetical protein
MNRTAKGWMPKALVSVRSVLKKAGRSSCCCPRFRSRGGLGRRKSDAATAAPLDGDWRGSGGRDGTHQLARPPIRACPRQSLCAGASIHARVVSLSCAAAPASCLARRRNAATAGVELGAGHGGRHKSVCGADDANCGASGVGLRSEQVRITVRRTRGGTSASAAIHSVH